MRGNQRRVSKLTRAGLIVVVADRSVVVLDVDASHHVASREHRALRREDLEE